MSVPMLLRGTVVQVSQPLAAMTSVIRVQMAITMPAMFTAVLYLRLRISLKAYMNGFKHSTSLCFSRQGIIITFGESTKKLFLSRNLDQITRFVLSFYVYQKCFKDITEQTHYQGEIS
jgi:hypothetical protein